MFYESVGERGRGVFSQNNMYILTVDEKQHTFIEGMFTFCYNAWYIYQQSVKYNFIW